ncbi:GNAT family N-acetyltransferase [Microbacterium memoriense]|uniref:GNAT family N-acetyltransferase n=1 Tax=Microbacterium memoriense TaxID=2978350 RepID=A0ABT2PBS3_9MICO|nr:GNAT family N-acetyltransferase [Microbacterium memoriense]MCT9001288.1 GNAT family N-acetyltransferase [Microbacterium memoriense]
MSDLADVFHDAPLDESLRSGVAAAALEVRRVDDADRAQTDAWLEAVSRGFLDPERTEVQRQAYFDHTAHRRKVAVYDAGAPQPEIPVATFASWGTELSVPGAIVPACAISSVTVAPTHRRRGLLRHLMAGELRTAASLGFPLAALTVSESSIYGRFGFGAAVTAAGWEIDVRRAGWVGPAASGRIDFVSRERGRELAESLHDRIRPGMTGEVGRPGGQWDHAFGTRPDAEKAERLRVLQYRGDGGEVDGLVLYAVTENEADFASSAIDVTMLLAATDAAYASLWQFLLSMDLIATIRVGELAIDEPLWWMLADQRAATITLRDHHYLRVLDVPAALGARRYNAADTVVLEVDDPLGIAGGTFVLSVDESGAASIDPVDHAPLGELAVRTGITELSAILLGGVSPVTLAKAGRIQTDDPARVARVFATTEAPRLSFWY